MALSPKPLLASLAIVALTTSSCSNTSGSPPPEVSVVIGVTPPDVVEALTQTYSDPITFELKGQPTGFAQVGFELTQAVSDLLTVTIQYKTDGQPWSPATVLEDLTDLAPAPGDQGPAVTTPHVVTWNLAEDLGPGLHSNLRLRVVVAGGPTSEPGPVPLTVDLFGFPFASTSGLGEARSGHTGLVRDDGRLLVLGGRGNVGVDPSLASSELGDRGASFEDFSFQPAAPLTVARGDLAATRMPDGTWILTGGANGDGARAEAERYDPTSGAITPLADMIHARQGHGTAVLANGRLVVLAGRSDATGGAPTGNSYEIHDALLDSWTVGALLHTYGDLTATSLSDGRILLVGCEPGTDVTRAEYLTLTGDLQLTPSAAPAPPTARHGATATALIDGRVLLLGGHTAAGLPSSPVAELFDPLTETYTAVAADNPAVPGYAIRGRWGHSARLTGVGQVHVAGGRNAEPGGLLALTDVFTPGADRLAPSVPLPTPRSAHHADRLPNGHLVLSGGNSEGAGEPALDQVLTMLPLGGQDSLPGASGTGLVYGVFGGLVEVDYDLFDAESDPVRVRFEWTTRPEEPGSWRSMTPKTLFGFPVGDGYHSLATSPSGVAHAFGWDSIADDIFAAGSPQEFHVRITPIGAEEGATIEFSQILP